ncbi:Uncharacterised protein [uncultured archaeon]|nr:Uncharacterised protein [uncultured archaeon]
MGEIKEDILDLQNQIDFLKRELLHLKREISSLKDLLLNYSSKTDPQKGGLSPAIVDFSQTDRQRAPINNSLFKPLKAKILGISIGNGGVPADRKTDQQTDKLGVFDQRDPLKEAPKLLESLDDLRREIRLKFKQLTEQEFLVFSAIYQLEEERGSCDYRLLATHLNLTESSIRDYVVKLIKKGIPVEKTKLNNKSVTLSISKNLKVISTLPTIFQLRNL